MKHRAQVVDYSHEVRSFQSPIIRYGFITLSFCFLILGIIGIFLPILPTTPYVLLSAALFARSSPRFYNWIMNHKTLGPPLRKWKEKGAINRRAKVMAIGMLSLTMIISVFFLVPLLTVKLILIVIWFSVGTFLWTRPEA